MSRKIVPVLISILMIPALAGGDSSEEERTILDFSRELSTRRGVQRAEAHRLAGLHGWPLGGAAPDGTVFELQGISRGLPFYYTTFNADAAASTRADTTAALTGGGAGFEIGLWDAAGARMTHQELIGRVTWKDTHGYSVGDHATHVTGTMIASGVDSRAKGMSPAATLASYEWNDDLAEMAAAAAEGLLISNHSYGTVRGWAYYGEWYWFGDTAISATEDYLFGFYDDLARDTDAIMHAAPDYLVVVSAGNDRNDSVPPGTEHLYFDVRYNTWRSSVAVRDRDGGESGYDCVTNGMQASKNAMVVGAVEDVPVYSGPADVVQTEFSGWGPVDDGRIKPDIVGNGSGLFSSLGGGDMLYGSRNGTSMAAPNICGSLALLQDYYMDLHGGVPMQAATLKGMAIHTAREAGPAPGPDYAFGWGLLDAYAAYRLIGADTVESNGHIEEFTLNEGYPVEFMYQCDGTADELRVTISWTDPPGTPPGPALDPPDLMLVNDLDLLVSGNGSSYEPWILDPAVPSAAAATGNNVRDNVEQVVIPAPEAGIYTVRIDHKGDIPGGVQDFALVVTGAVRTMTLTVKPDGTGDVPDIATALATAADGWMVLLYPGIFYEHDLVVDKQIVVKSTGSAAETRIDAQGNGRCLSIPASDDTVRIENVSFTGGVAYDAGGDGRGGGIYIGNGNVDLVNCSVSGCDADAGGGIYIDSCSPALLNCGVLENSSNGNGGGIYVAGGSASLDHCVIAGNLVKGNGGGIYFDAASAGIDFCTISWNVALGHGGGAAIGAGSAAVFYGTIVSHTRIGEGIYVYPDGGVQVGCCNVFGNAGGNYSGEIGDLTGTNANISEDPRFCDLAGLDLRIGDDSPCRPEGNTCLVRIGALGVGCHTRRFIEVSADGSGDYPTIQAALDYAADGDTVLLNPGIYRGDGNRELTFAGKAVVLTSTAGADSTVIDCESDGVHNHVGFIFWDAEDSTSVLEGVTVTGASEGGIWCLEGSSPTVRECVFRGNNTIAGRRGGGAYVSESSPLFVECVFDSNETNASGGGIDFRTSETRIERCIIRGNTAALYGGGIEVKNSSGVRIVDCTISGNGTIANAGGGVYIIGAAASIEGCIVIGNAAAQSGGGIFNGISGALSISETIIAGNSAPNGGGGLYSAADMTMVRCTVTGNSSGFYGGGIECQYGDGNLVESSIVAFNGTAGGIYTIMNDIAISCSDVYGNIGGDYVGGTADMTGTDGNISEDPRFCEPDSSDYRLYNVSPCLPAQSPCGMQIGAFSSGCIDTLVTGADEPGLVPASTELRTVYPNPFNPSTAIRFDLARPVRVTISIYDVAGRRVRMLVDEDRRAGSHTAVWRGEKDGGGPVASGIYFVRFRAGDVTETRKIVLLR